MTVRFHLKQYNRKLDVMKAIDEIEYVYGFTNRADALRVMRTDMFSPENGDRPNVQVKEINCCCEETLFLKYCYPTVNSTFLNRSQFHRISFPPEKYVTTNEGATGMYSG